MSQKRFISIALVVLVAVLVGVTGYFVLNNRSATPTSNNNLPVTGTTPTDWQFIDAGFTLSLPPEWKFNKLQGTDSYVGEFVGDGVNLGFDYGRYSSPLTKDNDPHHIVTYETIDGYKAKIVVPKVVGSGTTGVYFGDLGGGGDGIEKIKLQVSGYNLTASQQEIALKIFHTLKFKR